MRILVTGSEGVIGQKLVQELAQRGHSVFGCDIYHRPGEIGFFQKMSSENWTYNRCDIGEYRQIERLIRATGPYDLVYNCAAEVGRWNGEDFYEQVWRTNLVGLKNIIRLQEELKFKLVHFSSSEVYGDYQDIMFETVMDKFAVKQLNEYAISKWANELQIHNSASLFCTETVIVRLFNTYGPGEFYTPYRSVNAKFCFHGLKRLPITVFKGHTRSSTYLDDSVRTIANISDNFIPGRTYNIGTNQSHTIELLAELTWKHAGAPMDMIEYKTHEMSTTTHKKIDNTLTVTELDHRDTVTLEEGIIRTLNWMRDYYRLT